MVTLLLHFRADFQLFGVHMASLHQLAVTVHPTLDDFYQDAGKNDGYSVADSNCWGHN